MRFLGPLSAESLASGNPLAPPLGESSGMKSLTSTCKAEVVEGM